ncbi:MAG: hypothetical protein LBJ10_06010 [Clostridiales bacterium]|jgi:hypothetical protein|nr:hypothetical protein [Clostridiales bacterium]
MKTQKQKMRKRKARKLAVAMAVGAALSLATLVEVFATLPAGSAAGAAGPFSQPPAGAPAFSASSALSAPPTFSGPSAGQMAAPAQMPAPATAIAAVQEAEAEAAANALLLDAINAAGEGTEPFFVTVTKPVGGETVYKSAFSICGARSDEAGEGEYVLYLAKLNEATGLYEEFLNVDGEARVPIGLNGVFSDNVLLSEGSNSFAIAVCSMPASEALAAGGGLEPGAVQVTKFEIVCKGQSVADKISEKLKEHTLLSIFKELESAQKA